MNGFNGIDWRLIYQYASAGAGAVFGILFGEWTPLFTILTALIVIDYVSGTIAGFVQGHLSSVAGFKGIAKKVGIFLLISVGHIVDKTLGSGSAVQDAVMMFYIANEVISIVENAGRMGVPVPPVLQKAVEILREKADDENTKGVDK